MPKQYSEYDDVYDSQTIRMGKEIKDKKELHEFCYHRWKHKGEPDSAYEPKKKIYDILYRNKTITKKDRRKYCFTDDKAKKTKMYLWEQIQEEAVRLSEILGKNE